MQGKTKEQWFQLCQLAAVEQDPAKMLMLVQEIGRLLKEKEAWLKRTLKRKEGADLTCLDQIRLTVKGNES